MVKITVLFEGGADPRSNPNADTCGNTAHLRESFNKLLNSGLPSDLVTIEAVPVYSKTNAVKIRQKDAFLLIDLDMTKDKKLQHLQDNHLLDIQEFVFFMVQRMEAWILSQPEIIEKVFEKIKINQGSIADDLLIKGKNPEEIHNPDWVLNVILQRFFAEQKAGKLKKLKYGKLKTAPQLIENLDITILCNTFEDAHLLIQKITEFTIERN